MSIQKNARVLLICLLLLFFLNAGLLNIGSQFVNNSRFLSTNLTKTSETLYRLTFNKTSNVMKTSFDWMLGAYQDAAFQINPRFEHLLTFDCTDYFHLLNDMIHGFTACHRICYSNIPESVYYRNIISTVINFLHDKDGRK